MFYISGKWNFLDLSLKKFLNFMRELAKPEIKCKNPLSRNFSYFTNRKVSYAFQMCFEYGSAILCW